MSFKQPPVRVNVDSIYAVGKLKKEVSYVDLDREILTFYTAVKGNWPENIIICYKDENGENISMTLEQAGKEDLCKTVRAIAAVGACIFLRKNDVDAEAIREIYCLGHYAPSVILANRGNIFSSDSSVKINCRRVPDLVRELLK